MTRSKYTLATWWTLAVAWLGFTSGALATSCQSRLSVYDLNNTSALRARVQSTLIKQLQTYACADLVNYFAVVNGIPSDIVKGKIRNSGGRTEVVFGNEIDTSLCGTLRYGSSPESGLDFAQSSLKELHSSLSEVVTKEFVASSQETSKEIEDWVTHYIPEGLSLPRPTGEIIVQIIDQLVARIQSRASRIIAEQPRSGSTKDQISSSIGCTISIPEATGPHVRSLENYPSAWKAYVTLTQDLIAKLK